MLNRLTNLSRISKQLLTIFLDSILLITILWISYSIRLEYWYFPKDDTIRLILVAPIIGIPIFAKLGLYQSVIRHIDLKTLWTIVQAVSLYALIWGLVGFFIQTDIVRDRGINVEIVPRSVMVVNWILAILIISAVRIGARFFLSDNTKFSILNYEFESKIDNVDSGKNKTDNIDSGKSRVLIYGAGDAGVQLSLALNNSSKIHAVGFIDDILRFYIADCYIMDSIFNSFGILVFSKR